MGSSYLAAMISEKRSNGFHPSVSSLLIFFSDLWDRGDFCVKLSSELRPSMAFRSSEWLYSGDFLAFVFGKMKFRRSASAPLTFYSVLSANVWYVQIYSHWMNVVLKKGLSLMRYWK